MNERTVECILGDLREEFLILRRERGACRACLWYARQALLSLPRMVKPEDALRALSVAFALMLLDRLWCFTYSMIPLKDGLERAPGLLAVNVVFGCLCAAIFRPGVSWALLATLLAVTLAVSAQPPLYVCLILISVPTAAHLRRVREIR